MYLKRFYLDKGMEKTGVPNGKFRPIGSPDFASRVISKALNDMVYFINHKDAATFQHGYRMNRGTYSALYKTWEYIFVDGHRSIYEFDFQSFFNTVTPSAVYDALNKKSKLLANLIFKVLKDVRYHFEEEIKNEAEIKKLYPIHKMVYQSVKGFPEKQLVKKLKLMVERFGMPQGLSISPVLATLVLNTENVPKNLVMYADDGLIFGEDVRRY